ncbi:hypothetical protein Tco_0205128 [Tanacetum coccineum]
MGESEGVTQAEHLEGNSLNDCSLSDLEMLKDLEEREFAWIELPDVEDEVEGLCGLLVFVPSYPSLVGSSSVPDCLDNITTTWRMVGRSLGLDLVHSNPIYVHIATWSGSAEVARIGSIWSGSA